MSLVLLAAVGARPGPSIWRLDGLQQVGGAPVEVLGAPKIVESGTARAVRFDGKTDGLVVPIVPLAGLAKFTIETLFMPESGGEAEQRFFHIQDDAGARALLEIRLTPEGLWALDTFLLSGESRLALLDRTRLHSADQWHWVALRYDGETMSHFVDGVLELQGTVRIPPMKDRGQTSLGVRLNRVYWFKGSIREVWFHPEALPADRLQRLAEP